MDACMTDDYIEVIEPQRTPERPARESRYVDFAAVPPSQWAMHDRLENWARWCRGASGESARISPPSPMFSGFRSSDARRVYGDETTVPIDKMDAQRVAKGVAALPEKHRRSLHWLYVHGAKQPTEAARQLGLSREGLRDVVRDARQMLVNRGT